MLTIYKQATLTDNKGLIMKKTTPFILASLAFSAQATDLQTLLEESGLQNNVENTSEVSLPNFDNASDFSFANLNSQSGVSFAEVMASQLSAIELANIAIELEAQRRLFEDKLEEGSNENTEAGYVTRCLSF